MSTLKILFTPASPAHIVAASSTRLHCYLLLLRSTLFCMAWYFTPERKCALPCVYHFSRCADCKMPPTVMRGSAVNCTRQQWGLFGSCMRCSAVVTAHFSDCHFFGQWASVLPFRASSWFCPIAAVFRHVWWGRSGGSDLSQSCQRGLCLMTASPVVWATGAVSLQQSRFGRTSGPSDPAVPLPHATVHRYHPYHPGRGCCSV